MVVDRNPHAGITLPVTSPRGGTTLFATAVLADAVRGFDADLAQTIESSRRWRHEYTDAFRAMTAVSASAPVAAVGIAEAGLASAHNLMRFISGAADAGFESDVVRGTRDAVHTLRVPFGNEVLEGEALRAQLRDWRDRGIVEPSFVTAIDAVIDNPQWLSLPGHQTVVVGAGSELGPYLPLIDWGADVLAIDLPGADRWRRIVQQAKDGAGTVTYPTGPAGPGVDVSRNFSGVLNWIYANTSKRKKLVFGMYAYADGRAHVEVTLAADVIAVDLLQNRPKTTLAYLATPTDCFAVKADVMAEARRRWAARGRRAAGQELLRIATRSALMRPNYCDEVVDRDGNHWGLADTLISAQGPNYALAKRLQRWRGVVTRNSGQRISFNVAPASWTRSVTKNAILASAYHGAGRFGVEIFAPDTARTLMAAKLVSDLFAPVAVEPNVNPEELFYEGAAHGGLWRQPFEPLSVLSLAAAQGYPLTLFERLRHAPM